MYANELSWGEPNIVTIFLGITGIAILVMTCYVVVKWQA